MAPVKRWLFGPQVDEPLAYEGYTGTTTPGSGSVIELLANRLGSIITAISVSTGAVAADYDYQAYGARVETGSIEQPYGFTGREHDAESGLIHYRARSYDPEAGMFLQVDPIGFASGTFGLYGYVTNNPVNWADPSGLGTETLSWNRIRSSNATTAFNSIGAIGAGLFNLVARIERAIRIVGNAVRATNVVASTADDGEKQDDCAPTEPPSEPWPFGWENAGNGRIHGSLKITGPIGPSDLNLAIAVLQFSIKVRIQQNEFMYLLNWDEQKKKDHDKKIKEERDLLNELQTRKARIGC